MVGLPFFDDDTTPAIRVPAIQIDIGGGGDSGGFGGMADAASSLLGGPAAPSWADHLVSLTLQQGFAPGVDHLELLVANTEGAPTAAVDDEGSVSIGPSDNLEKLFTGRVVAVEKRSDGLRRYHLSNGSHTLAQGRLNRSVTDMSAKDAIENLGSEFGYSPNASISGNDAVLSQIVFDDSGSVWEHCAHLARLRSANLWLDADDTLQLADQLEQGDSVASFTWGENLLEHQLWQRAPHSGEITAFGNGRIDGDFTLRKTATPNRAQTGSDAPQRFYRDGMLQSQQDLAGRANAAALFAARRTNEGELLVAGSAKLVPGAVITLEGLPDGGDGDYLVSACRHTFDRDQGWRTRLTVSETAAASGLSGLAGALGGFL